MRSKFYFVAGEQVMTRVSTNVFDAWLGIKLGKHWASEYEQLPITAFDADGEEIATRSFEQWDNAVLQDTYGSNYEEVLINAERLLH